MPKHPGRTALYRLYAKRKRLLYIGISHNPDVRWGQHSLKKDWWHEVERREVIWFETRIGAEAAERETIREENPRHNLQHRSIPPLIPRIDLPDGGAALYSTFRKAREERAALEPEVRRIVASALQQGAKISQLVALTGMNAEVIRRLRSANDIPVDPRYQSRAELARARKAALPEA